MSYRSIIKEFNNAVVTENQKLRDIYSKLLNESVDDTDVDVTSESCCDEDEPATVKDKPHNLHISAKQFLESDDAAPESTPVETPDDTETTDDPDGSDSSAEESPENVDGDLMGEDDDSGVLVSAKEFFGSLSDDGDQDGSEGDSEEDGNDDVDESTPTEPEDDSESDDVVATESSKQMTPSTIFGDDNTETEPEQQTNESTETDKDNGEKPEETPVEPSSESVEKPVDDPVKNDDSAVEFFNECGDTTEKTDDVVDPVVTEREEVVEDPGEDYSDVKDDPVDPEDDEYVPGEDYEEEDDEAAAVRDLHESLEAIKLFAKASKKYNC